MPQHDHTGPLGQGPATGHRRGTCKKKNLPETTPPTCCGRGGRGGHPHGAGCGGHGQHGHCGCQDQASPETKA